jgi:hypothetical protein
VVALSPILTVDYGRSDGVGVALATCQPAVGPLPVSTSRRRATEIVSPLGLERNGVCPRREGAGHMLIITMAVGASVGGGWFLGVVVALLLVGFPLSAWRYQKRGPALRWVPRRWRAKTGRWYSDRGWEVPYDADGNKTQRW